jgi:Family of unknown function (DUF6518)
VISTGSRRSMVVLAAALAGGLAFGVADYQLAGVGGAGTGTAAEFWTVLGNVSSLWLVLPFLAGMAARRQLRAAAAGLAVSVSAVCGFYGYKHFILGTANGAYLLHAAAIVLAAAAITGPVYGVLGNWWAAKRSRIAAFAIWGAFVFEPVAWLARLSATPYALAVFVPEALLGVVLALAFERAARRSRSARGI